MAEAALDNKVDIFELAEKAIPASAIRIPEDAREFESRGDTVEGHFLETKRIDGETPAYRVTIIDNLDPRATVSRTYQDFEQAITAHLRIKEYFERGRNGHSS